MGKAKSAERKNRLEKKRMFGRDIAVDVCVVRGMWPSSRKEIKKREATRRGFYTQHPTPVSLSTH